MHQTLWLLPSFLLKLLPEAPELEFFEWEVKCARETHEELKAQIENEMAGLKLLNAAHATHALVVRQFATVERLAVELRALHKTYPEAS